MMTVKNNIFFIVGAQRSGTTYLYKILDSHPEICMSKPVRPEPKYFINKTKEELNIKFYLHSFFEQCKKNKILGEKSTSYYEHKETPDLIKHAFPNAKILFILRNPVDRALSNYKFNVDNKIETRTLKEIFLQKKPKPILNFKPSVDPFNYLGRGEYSKFIKHYLHFFEAEQIKVIIFEELIKKTETEISELYNFLEVKSEFIPENYKQKVNQSKSFTSIDSEVLRYLEKYYYTEINNLEKLINKDLTIWKKTSK